MKTHTSGFSTTLKIYGRELDTKITCGEIELDSEVLNKINLSFSTELLKTVMKHVEFDSNTKINKYNWINVKSGVKVESAYEYLDYGNYYINDEPLYNADTLSYTHNAYDKMIESMVFYDDDPLEIIYPISVESYLNAICAKLGWTLSTESYANMSVEIESDLYAGLGLTYRDILDDLCPIIGGNLMFSPEDNLIIKKPTDTSTTIDDESLKDTNITIGKKYGPINSLVLSRAEDGDTINRQDTDSITANGLFELKIRDNLILDTEYRENFIDGIFNSIKGIEYYTYDISTVGLMVYDPLDIFTFSHNGDSYKLLMLNDSLTITQGLKEDCWVDEPEESTTDYTTSAQSDKAQKMAIIIAYKNQAQIKLLVQQQSGSDDKIASLELDVDGITTSVSNISNELDLENPTSKLSTISQSIEDVTTAFREKGFSNLIHDSLLTFGGVVNSNFTKTGTWIAHQSSEISNNTVSNYMAQCTSAGGGKVEWIIRTIPNTAYTLALKYSNTDGETSTAIINNSGVEIEVLNTSETKSYDTVGKGFVATGSFVTVTIETDGTHFGYSDLMLNYGVLDVVELTPNALVWQPAFGEVAGTNIKMSYDGIEIFMIINEDGTYALKHIMDASGSRIVDANDNIITSFDVDGIVTNKLTLVDRTGSGTTQLDIGNFTLLAIDTKNCIFY